MNKTKLKLSALEPKIENELPAEFLSKIFGGQDYEDTSKQNSNAPDYSVSTTTSLETETKNEVGQ